MSQFQSLFGRCQHQRPAVTIGHQLSTTMRLHCLQRMCWNVFLDFLAAGRSLYKRHIHYTWWRFMIRNQLTSHDFSCCQSPETHNYRKWPSLQPEVSSLSDCQSTEIKWWIWVGGLEMGEGLEFLTSCSFIFWYRISFAKIKCGSLKSSRRILQIYRQFWKAWIAKLHSCASSCPKPRQRRRSSC